MDEKVDLSTNAASYSIEVDLEDLSLGESLTSRYDRYSSENQSKTRQADSDFVSESADYPLVTGA